MNVAEWVRKGQVLERAGQWAKAAQWYRQGMVRHARQPQVAALGFHLGVVLRKQGDVKGAVLAYEQAARLAPGMWQVCHGNRPLEPKG